MPPNLRKSQPNLANPSEGGSLSAGKKPTESTNPLQGLNIAAERELGSAGGIKATGKLTVGVDNLIGQQGIKIEADAANRTLGVGVGIGSTKGKLGVNIGGKVGYDEEGKISIRGAEVAINIGGFGGSASIDDEKGIGGSISVAGAKIEVTVSPDGKKTLSLCYGIPGGELCTIFEPDPGIKIPGETMPPDAPGKNMGIGFNADELINYLDNNSCYHVVFLWHVYFQYEFTWSPNPNVFVRSSLPEEIHGQGVWTNDQNRFYATTKNLPYERTPAFIEEHIPPSVPANESYNQPQEFTKYKANFKAWAQINSGLQIIIPNGYRYAQNFLLPFHQIGTGAFIKDYIQNWRPIGEIWDMSAYKIPCSASGGNQTPVRITPPIVNPPLVSINLPNYPQILKPMDNCCEKVEEIYKYLGIAKLKKNKFKVAKQFLVPRTTGNEECEDYYSINEALFKMLANGLIINPVSKPLGSEWQNVNATAWASEMYEMLAEAKSDGNSTQVFELHAGFQLVQLAKVLAELTRKVEFLSEALGYMPKIESEDMPVMFTIHESHKGFGKKELKEIDITKAKTDEQVEKILGTMLTPSKIPITKWVFKPGQISINEALSKI